MHFYVSGKRCSRNSENVWQLVGFAVLVVWATAVVSSLVLRVLGFPIPEILNSSEFMVAGCGFSFLYYSLMYGQRRATGKAELGLSFLGLTVGVSILFLGVYVVLFEAPNFFTFLCIAVGSGLIFLGAKRIRARKSEGKEENHSKEIGYDEDHSS